MKCPVCGNEFKKGVIEAKDAGSLTQSLTMLTWYPEEYKGKLVKKYHQSQIEDGWILL